ncbi:MAG: hypothetical protein A2622_06070 [Bdellovibrionales bacterium RIFCSPHIGHO2_01_FULL_40_29]|nr:MAG: hypothetical protein A2622_06070 [Bdellovibrionales bacterium RIFCSPHIGHO2_01_FULL_40_29]OFZ35016.1 MAG: hypothetical protein A3D17_06420 [Bdellovibrionales bacterium RIFCSPHIGHO2_02_FULL_40_15]
MKIFLFITTLIFSLYSFAECAPGDRNCVMKSGGAGTNVPGIDCLGCRALEKSNVRLDGTSTNYRGVGPDSPDTDPNVKTGN